MLSCKKNDYGPNFLGKFFAFVAWAELKGSNAPGPLGPCGKDLKLAGLRYWEAGALFSARLLCACNP